MSNEQHRPDHPQRETHKALFDAIQLLDSQALEPSDRTFTALAAYGFDLASDTEKVLND